ncbi:fatty acid desaturase [Skermanella stibiiresistens SB22]|uniref:Fatty acid desaturase n=1 Tax=Skermanella stibiiresistens SB22 TaxID=1385369 RepID=W9H0N1_9PROT|nr:fatty acid desaturase [Skermanella stibiiresistens]EWY39730.1 fatty acid desaturase [Skermanella stibiiresistens SB22]
MCASTPTPADIQARKQVARRWAQQLAAYKQPVLHRSVGQIGTTLLPLAGIVVLMGLSLEVGYWLTLLLAVPAAFFLVRAFILQHDCGHGSLFKSGRANDILGRCLAVLTMTPYGYWKREHAIHHATSGNLEKRGVGDITTLTVREYLALSRWGRLRYRAYRHPIVLFGIGPAFMFLIRHRIAIGDGTNDRAAWTSVLGTNGAILLAFLVATLAFEPLAILMVWGPVILFAATIGIWMFYVQHQFEGVQWHHEEEWDFHGAALDGCSFYDLPRWLHWLTGYIGYHHVHHLSSKIPNYRLRDCHLSIPDLQRVRSLGLFESLKTVSLALWDEDNRRMIRFGELRHHMA